MTTTSLPAPLGLIGNTPMVQMTRLDTGPCTRFDLLNHLRRTLT